MPENNFPVIYKRKISMNQNVCICDCNLKSLHEKYYLPATNPICQIRLFIKLENVSHILSQYGNAPTWLRNFLYWQRIIEKPWIYFFTVCWSHEYLMAFHCQQERRFYFAKQTCYANFEKPYLNANRRIFAQPYWLEN